MKLYYFGTNLTSAGHYLFELEGNACFTPARLQLYDLPFNPEGLPHTTKQEGTYKNGRVEFYDFAGYRICAIEGSCYDDRPGSKSIFFIEKPMWIVYDANLKEFILSVPYAKRIIDQMETKFKINW
jgi:hypothetical protein